MTKLSDDSVDEKENLIAECVERVLQILKDIQKQER